MFAIIATKPLNDRTSGFRFNFLGKKGIVRKLKVKSRGLSVQHLKTMTALHIFKRTIYLEKISNRHVANPRRLRHFAG